MLLLLGFTCNTASLARCLKLQKGKHGFVYLRERAFSGKEPDACHVSRERIRGGGRAFGVEI